MFRCSVNNNTSMWTVFVTWFGRETVIKRWTSFAAALPSVGVLNVESKHTIGDGDPRSRNLRRISTFKSLDRKQRAHVYVCVTVCRA